MSFTAENLLANLGQFSGTEKYHRWSVLFPRHALTDGAKYLADKAGAYWLMDAIASYAKSCRDEDFVVAHLWKRAQLWWKREEETWMLSLDNGSGKVLARQLIEYSDFPLDDIKLYVGRQDNLWVIMLPSEF